LPAAGTYTLDIPATKKTPHGRRRWKYVAARSSFRAEKRQRLVRKCGIKEINMWVVEAREIDAPKILSRRVGCVDSDCVENFDDAWRF